MINEPISEALFWKYFKKGSSISTKQNEDGSFVITAWKISDGTPQPDETTILSVLSEYKSFLVSEKSLRRTRKKSLVQKLNMSKQDIRALAEVIEDKDDD